MKKTNWTDRLTGFTRGTIVVCGVLLVLCSVVVMILMFFPIQKEDHPTVVVEPVRHTEYSATTHTTATRPEITTTSGTHTLSTWNAGIHGFNSDVNEHLGTQNPRYTTMDPRLTRRETTTLREGQRPVVTTLGEGEIPFIMPATTTRPETVTETVLQTETEVDTDEPAEMTAPPLPVEEIP